MRETKFQQKRTPLAREVNVSVAQCSHDYVITWQVVLAPRPPLSPTNIDFPMHTQR